MALLGLAYLPLGRFIILNIFTYLEAAPAEELKVEYTIGDTRRLMGK